MSHATPDEIRGWFAGRLPDAWFTGAPAITVDREEILVVGPISAPEMPADSSDAGRAAGAEARVRRFREETRRERMAIAEEGQHRFGRVVSWGVTLDGERSLFTTASVPVMTRLRQPERRVLDTLVDAGVARSRSDALAWCVRLVGDNEKAWIGTLRDALRAVEEARRSGPNAPLSRPE